MMTQKRPNCGSDTDSSALVCYLCKHGLSGAQKQVKKDGQPSPGPRVREGAAPGECKRPGCVSAFAVLAFLSGVLGALSALSLPVYFTGRALELPHTAYAAPGFHPDAA